MCLVHPLTYHKIDLLRRHGILFLLLGRCPESSPDVTAELMATLEPGQTGCAKVAAMLESVRNKSGQILVPEEAASEVDKIEAIY